MSIQTMSSVAWSVCVMRMRSEREWLGPTMPCTRTGIPLRSIPAGDGNVRLQPAMRYTLSLTAWYLNPERIYQLINTKSLLNHLNNLAGHKGSAFLYSPEGITRGAIKQELEDWLHHNAIPSLGELTAKGETIRSGQLFTLYHNLYGKGLSKYSNPNDPIPRDAIAELHNKLKFAPDKEIRILYSPSNLISSSSWHRLSGQTRVFCFCYVESASNDQIIARPYIIGDIHTGTELETPTSWDGRNYGEIHPSAIDQFSLIHELREKEDAPPNLEIMKSISEDCVKNAIAEIINESYIPKDWGGEKSDLFSTNISVSGKRMSAAFLLKGPAKFSPMKMTHLGKNGDQIDRLFSEPADILFLQHCHSVTTAVRSTMRAFASRVHDLRYFCIIDGYDTLRILKAYSKCGQ